ncbi:MAG: TonB-dependent receptor plug domain-containing protein [Deltaproteobacteria bacterium]|nr:TonB-dependent receptor plug domain-containing protein [Deltaproteobacteria bacterium]
MNQQRRPRKNIFISSVIPATFTGIVLGISTSLFAQTKTDDTGEVATDEGYTTVVLAKRTEPVGTRTKIDSDEIQRRGARTVPDVLSFEPAVEVNRAPKTGATLQIRGYNEKSIQILFEGIPVAEVYDGHFEIDALPVFALADITLEKGVVSPLYGPNTTGGVVRLSVPDACRQTMDTTVYSRPSDGEMTLFGARSNLCFQTGDVTTFFGAGYERSDGYPLSDSYKETEKNVSYHESGGVRDGSDYQRASLTLMTRYAPRRNKSLTLFANTIHAPRSIPPFTQSGFTRYWRFNRYDTFLVGLKGTLGPETMPATFGFRGIEAHLYTHIHRDGLHDYTDATHTHLTDNPKAWFIKSAYANESFGADIAGQWALVSGNTLQLRLHYDLDRHRQHDLPVPNENGATRWGAWEHYVSHKYTAAIEDTQVLGKLRLNAGLGVSGMSLLAQKVEGESLPVDNRLIPGIEGRFAAEVTFSKRIRATAEVGHKVRLPLLKELFENVVGGNLDLEPEEAWMGELGLESSDIPFAGLDTSFHVFGSRIRNLIEKNEGTFDNIGRAVTAGTEFDIRYTPVPLFEIHGGYRYLFSKDLINDIRINYITPHRVVAGARLNFDFGLTASLEAVYNSGQHAEYSDATNQWVRDRTPDFVLLNSHIRYEPVFAPLKGGYLYIDGFNLTDANYVIGRFEPRPGREIIVGVGTQI